MKHKLQELTFEILHELHFIKNKSFNEIAKIYNVSRGAIYHHAKKLKFKGRTVLEASRLANCGENNPAKRPEVKIKLSGENNHFYGKKHTEETKKLLSEINSGSNHVMYGKKHKPETIEKMKQNNSMKNEIHRKKQIEQLRKNRHKFTGENSKLWRGGKSKLYYKIRALSEYKEWRMSVYKRDNFICVLCKNINNKKLNADHIKSFSIIIRENNIDCIEKAIECKELWNVDNGRTLCIECHKQTDNYGVKVLKNEQKKSTSY